MPNNPKAEISSARLQFPSLLGKPSSTPLATLILSIVVCFVASVMLGVSALHWGGEYDWLGVPLMFGGIFLWVVVFIIALRSYFVGEKVGDWLDALVILFLAYSIFSFQRSEAGFPARLEFMWTWVYGGLFFAMRYGVHNRDWMIGMTLFFVFIASLVCLYALINKDNPTHEIWGLERPNYGVRISGTFGCPNHFANFLSLATASAFYLGTVEKFPWPLRILLFYLSGLFTVGIFFSVSRGGYLAWLFAMAPITGYVLRTIRIKWWWKVFVSTIFVSGILLTIFRNDFVLGRLERTLSGDIRLQLIVDAVKIWNQDRWFGTGTASFDFYHLRFPDFHAGRAVHTHNDYLNTLSDYGAVGLGLVLLFLLGYLLQLIIRSKYLKSERETTLWRIGFSALAAMAIHETVDFNLHIPACAILFFALVGMSVSRTFRQRKCRKYYLSFAPVILLAGLAMFIWVTPLIWQTWCGQQLSRYSQEELLSMDSSEVIFKADQAYTADPGASKTQVHYANALRVKASQKVTELKQTGTRRLSDYREAENLAKKAIQIYTRVHESNPLEDTLIVNIAMTYDAIDDFQSASLYYKKALDLRPHSGTFHYALGFHYLNQNNLKNALFSFKKAMNQGNKLPDIQRQVDEADRMIRLINKQLKETPRH